MHFFRRWLINVVLAALKERDELIDAELAALRGTGGQDNADRYAALRDWRYW